MTHCVAHGEVPVQASVDGLCGTLEVPEDRSSPSGPHIALRVVVVPALAAVPAADPLFALAGGPGDASTEFFAWLPNLYTGVHATHDIVLVDQRGAGASNPLQLPPLLDTSGLSAAEVDMQLGEWAREGFGALDADPRFYTSTVAADDLDDVRAALGYDQIDLYGTSYGGTLAQYYLRQHPDHVRVAVLDGATPLDVPVLEQIATNSQHALDLLLARCDQDAQCHHAFPRVQSEWTSLVARLAETVTIANPEDPSQRVVLDLASVGNAIHHALLTGDTAAQVPLAIHLATEGDWLAASQAVPAPPSGGTTLVMAQEILCSEAWARFDPDEVARTATDSYLLLQQLAEAQSRQALCRHVPPGVVPVNDGAPVRTALPVLWLTSDGDAQDPPANLQAVPSQEPNSQIVVLPAQEHVVGHLGCMPSIIAAFLDAGSVTGLDVSCAAHGPADTPGFRVP